MTFFFSNLAQFLENIYHELSESLRNILRYAIANVSIDQKCIQGELRKVVTTFSFMIFSLVYLVAESIAFSAFAVQ